MGPGWLARPATRAERHLATLLREMEEALAETGKTIDESSLEEMEELWKQAKTQTAE